MKVHRHREMILLFYRAKSCLNNSTIVEFELNQRMHYVKLRPGVHTFLKTLHAYFDIQIFTWGTREYAEKVVAVLDPDGQGTLSSFLLRFILMLKSVIKGRMTARDDIDDAVATNQKIPPQKQLERLLPVCESMALILDDSAGVWRNLQRNLVEIRKFVFFPVGSEFAHGRAGGGSSSASLFLDDGFDAPTLQCNERDNVLTSIQTLFIRLHRLFYASDVAVDIRELFRNERRKILSGSHDRRDRHWPSLISCVQCGGRVLGCCPRGAQRHDHPRS